MSFNQIKQNQNNISNSIYQIFLSNTNNLHPTVCFFIRLHTVKYFQVLLYNASILTYH